MAFLSGLEDPLLDVQIDEPADAVRSLDASPSPASKADVGTALDDDVVSPRIDHRHVSQVRPEDVMQSVLDIFQLEEEEASPSAQPADRGEMDEPDAVVDVFDRNRRTDRLRGVYSALDQLWWSGSNLMVGATERLADGSRDPKWRLPMGESGILNSFLAMLASGGVQPPLMIHVLRLIGNSCADTDENRERVVSSRSIPVIIALLNETTLLPFVIPVLFNICVDYEPAQKQASESHLTEALVEILSEPTFFQHKAFLGYVCKLLDMMVEQPNEVEIAPDDVSIKLFKLGLDHELAADVEDFLSLSNTGINYLRHPRFQKALIRSGVELAIKIMTFSYTRFNNVSTQQEIIESSTPEQEDARLLTLMRSNMNQVLSDVSALPEFSAQYPVLSPAIYNIRRYLSSPQVQMQVCACIMLGNVARSDQTCEEFVHTSRVHKPLIAVLTDTTDAQLLHAALGFLKNLALPARNKVELGDAGLMDMLPRLWTMDTLPQTQYSSVSLARQLVIGNFHNVRRICTRLSEDTSSPANEHSKLSILIAVFQRTDAEPIKMEIARLITAICRVYTSPNQNVADVERRRKVFFERHPDLGRPLSFMISQKKWPVVRSEGWFVMALMARTAEGVDCITEILHDPSVFQALVEVLTGKSMVDGAPLTSANTPIGDTMEGASSAASSSTAGPSPEATMQRIDRENALVLVSEVLRQRGAQMARLRRSVFEDLLQGGGLMHLTYAQVQEREDFFDGSVQRVISGQATRESLESGTQSRHT